MSIFITVIDTFSHFGSAIEGIEGKLSTGLVSGSERLSLMVQCAYCYSYVKLPKGVAMAGEVISEAEQLNDNRTKAYALCARAMNLYRMGYTARAQTDTKQALSIFESLEDDAGISEALFVLGIMIHIGIGPGDSEGYLLLARQQFERQGNPTGIYLTRIHHTMLLQFRTKFDEAFSELDILLNEVDVFPSQHLRCMIYCNISFGWYFKNDMHSFRVLMAEWQKLAMVTGNMYDYAITKSMITECRRIEHLDKQVIQECIESIECCEQLGSFYGSATTSIIMGNICMDQSQYADGLHYFQKANAAASEILDGHLHCISLIGIGKTLVKTGKTEEARKTFETVLKDATVKHDRINQAAAQRHLAELALDQGDFDDAFTGYRNLFENAAGNGLDVKDYSGYALAISNATDTALTKAGIQPGERGMLRFYYLEQHLELALKQENKREETNAYSHMAKYYEDMGLFKEALHYCKQHIRLYEQISNEQNLNAIMNLRMQYETEKKDTEIALLKTEKEEALLLERLRISRNLHDDMGATLSSISVYSTAIKQRLGENRLEEAQRMLDTISEDARDMVSNMSDMVWMINPQNDTMGKLCNRMRQFASNVLSAKDILFHFHESDGINNMNIPMEVRKNIFLIFKEAINNIAKYSCCIRVHMEINVKDGEIQMSITDNGKGFKILEHFEGDGLRNMKQRAAEMKGNLFINSVEGTGTTVMLKCIPV